MDMPFSTDARPEATPYYCGGCILRALGNDPKGLTLLDLYETVKNEDGMGSATFVLGLDWLYLLQAIAVDEEGRVTLCS